MKREKVQEQKQMETYCVCSTAMPEKEIERKRDRRKAKERTNLSADVIPRTIFLRMRNYHTGSPGALLAFHVQTYDKRQKI